MGVCPRNVKHERLSLAWYIKCWVAHRFERAYEIKTRRSACGIHYFCICGTWCWSIFEFSEYNMMYMETKSQKLLHVSSKIWAGSSIQILITIWWQLSDQRVTYRIVWFALWNSLFWWMPMRTLASISALIWVCAQETWLSQFHCFHLAWLPINIFQWPPHPRPCAGYR